MIETQWMANACVYVEGNEYMWVVYTHSGWKIKILNRQKWQHTKQNRKINEKYIQKICLKSKEANWNEMKC